MHGEIVVLDAEGRSSFQALQRALSENAEAKLVYYAFDLLHLDGRDLSPAPLEARRQASLG
jgi:bifunctional non-homologous end joining protein LigD